MRQSKFCSSNRLKSASYKTTVEELVSGCIDVRELHREGLLKGDFQTLPNAAWRWPGVQRVTIAKYLMRLELLGQSVPKLIRIEWTRCHYGGSRPWLVCACGKRAVRLFRGLGGYYCRTCCNAIYESQRRSTKARNYLQAYRLRQRLGGSLPVLDEVPLRRAGMRRKTYVRLCWRLRGLESRLPGSRVARPDWIPPLAY
jgi:hypothetical protein